MFRQSTGRAPHRYVLLHRIARAKQRLRILRAASLRQDPMPDSTIQVTSPVCFASSSE
jgi:hypothetical protein